MSHLRPAAVVLAALALLVTALAAPAAAVPAPSTPSLAAAARAFPHLEGGTRSVSEVGVARPRKECGQFGPEIKGSAGTVATYGGSEGQTTGREPGLIINAARFSKPASAKSSHRLFRNFLKGCPANAAGASTAEKSSAKSFKVDLGERSSGFVLRAEASDGRKWITNAVVILRARTMVIVLADSTDGRKPSVKRTIKLARLALRAAAR